MQGEARNVSRRDYENMIRAGIIGEDERVELIGGRGVRRLLADQPDRSPRGGAPRSDAGGGCRTVRVLRAGDEIAPLAGPTAHVAVTTLLP